MTGRTNYTSIANGDPMQGPAQIDDVAAHFDALIGEAVNAATDLPSSGNWTGRHILVITEGRDYEWLGTAWAIVAAVVHEYHIAVSCPTGSGTRQIASQVIPPQGYAQRVVVAIAGSIAIPSGTGASSLVVGVTGAGGTVTLAGGPQIGVSNTGTSYSALATVDITAGSSCTVTISATNAVIFGGNAVFRVLPAGTY